MNCRDQSGSIKGVSQQHYCLQRRLISTRKLKLCPAVHKSLTCDGCKSQLLSRTMLILPPSTVAGARRIYRQIRASTTCFTSHPSSVLLSRHVSVCRVQERQLPGLESTTVSTPFQCTTAAMHLSTGLKHRFHEILHVLINTCTMPKITDTECFCYSLCTSIYQLQSLAALQDHNMPQQPDQAARNECRQQQSLEVADAMEQQSDGVPDRSPSKCLSLAEQMAHLAQARLAPCPFALLLNKCM